jgi:hypothetical protein
MTEINWLHLTDLHRGMSSQSWLWPNIQEQFFADLRRLHDRCGVFDIVFFSGDLVQKGDAKEFIRFEQTLKRLYEELNELGSDPVLLSIPGNHDLKRPDLISLETSGLKRYHTDEGMRQEFWKESKSGARLLIRRSFSAYSNWLKTQPFRKPTEYRRGILPGDFAASIRKDDVSVGVIGLNTAFLQLTDGNYEGSLGISLDQLIGVCGEDFADWFTGNTCSFLMTHHPPKWLNRSSQDALLGEIAIPGRFIAHFCGHMHENLNESRSLGGDQSRRLWQGCSLFGLETFGQGRGIERRHGYSAGKLLFGNDTATVRVWPRRAERHQSGHWHFVIDTSVTLLEDEGTIPENVFTRYKRLLRPSRRPAKFSVAILSTDLDLGSARKSIAEHLRRSLGVSVMEGSACEDVGSHDLVVLLQGWWWDGGKAAKLWSAADGERRVALLVDEGSDWPPRRLTEFSAGNEIDTFRRQVTNPPQFSNPDQLPEMVAKIVTGRMQALGGEGQLGLRDWERKYLEFRLPAWRNGRTAQSQPHLFDAEEAEELYEPDLYISLDGASFQWRQGKDGYPQRVKRKSGKTRRQRIEPVDSKRRVRLARWLTVAELPRIALVGAPGGGKTIFLTRVAATVANACLGRNVEFEPDLKIESLRRGYGLPVPILLEATRIGQHDVSKAESLMRAIAEEIASASSKSPQISQLEEGLKVGRYLLLIDALDEIADTGIRSKVLTLLKGIAAAYPKTRFLLTTRSARYTGDLRFGPELETVEVAPLDRDQVKQLCENWSSSRNRDAEYTTALLSAAWGLADKVGGSSAEDQALTENPLMLTAICMVFETYRSLPDDRGRLCELLIDDLCRSRRSEDAGRGWKLDESQKKDLLQRIALEMQQKGAQTWPVEQAIQVAMQLVPTTDASPLARAKRYLDWAADHTGILRFQEGPESGEEIRFWHRIFREYLSAKRIAQEDTTAGDKVDKLWREGRLCHPFWEDVIRLLPRTLATIEKAKSVLDRLEQLASDNKTERGRLLGLAAAGIIENRDLFPEIRFSEMAQRMAHIYQEEGLSWNLRDRLLFLECLGRLDTKGGDPRLHEEQWVPISKAKTAPGGSEAAMSILATSLSTRPTTVQEFAEFVESTDFSEEILWSGMPPSVIAHRPNLVHAVHLQLRHPNWPVVQIGVGPAIAFCRWATKRRMDGKYVRLPTSSELSALLNASSQKYWWGKNPMQKGEEAEINHAGAGLKHPSPVGAFPPHSSGAFDLIGNVWEWGIQTHVRRTRAPKSVFGVFGLSYGIDPTEWVERQFQTAEGPWTFVHSELQEKGHPSIGFRCALASHDIKISPVDFARAEPLLFGSAN